MRVTNLMTRNPRSCHATDDLGLAARIMWEVDCGVVPIVDGDERVVGMLTDRDIAMAAFHEGKPLHDIPVARAMSRGIVRCVEGDPIDVALANMGRAAIRRLPVVDVRGRLVGLISLHDIARRAQQAKPWFSRAGLKEVGRALAAISRPRRRDVGRLSTSSAAAE
jgi:CBS domain-containing protein